MPIQLTTPINGGAFESHTLTHVKIQDFLFEVSTGTIRIKTHLGWDDAGEWKPPDTIRGGVTAQEFIVTGDDYDALVAKVTSAAGVPIYDEVARELYQYLLDKEYFVGTVV